MIAGETENWQTQFGCPAELHHEPSHLGPVDRGGKGRVHYPDSRTRREPIALCTLRTWRA